MLNPPHTLFQKRDAFRDWLLKKAFPYWGNIGCDGTIYNPYQWGSHEQLKMDGSPDIVGYKRLRVQARQLYSFTQSVFLGWTQGQAISENIYQFMQHAQQGEGHWAKTLTREGKILDSSVDLYDLAFIIFSFAWYARLSGDKKPIQQARQIIQWIEQYMAYPKGGFKHTFPITLGFRQQNPHMHLLEAALALYETTQQEQDLKLAHRLISLFQTVFFDQHAGILGEYYTENWIIPPCKNRETIEPGHQYEWIWLLSEYERLTNIPHHEEMMRMYRFNQKYSIDQSTGLVADQVQRDGTLTNKSARLWVQTEAIRATSLIKDEQSYQHLGRIVDNLLHRYFNECPPGTWQDQLDHKYQYMNKKIPTSSLYHIVSAYIQLDHTL